MFNFLSVLVSQAMTGMMQAPVMAGMHGMVMQPAPASPILLVGDVVCIVLTLVVVGLIFFSIRGYQRSSLGVVLLYFITGILLLGSIRLLFLLFDINVLQITADTVMTVWHIMFFSSTIFFLLAARSIIQLGNIGGSTQSAQKAILLSVIFLGVSSVLLIGGPLVNKTSFNFDTSVWGRIGIHHIIAFLCIGVVVFYLFQVRQKFRGAVGSIAQPFLTSLFFLSLIHLWELLTHSWGLIPASASTVEQVEQVLWIISLSLLIFTFFRFGKLSARNLTGK